MTPPIRPDAPATDRRAQLRTRIDSLAKAGASPAEIDRYLRTVEGLTPKAPAAAGPPEVAAQPTKPAPEAPGAALGAAGAFMQGHTASLDDEGAGAIAGVFSGAGAAIDALRDGEGLGGAVRAAKAQFGETASTVQRHMAGRNAAFAREHRGAAAAAEVGGGLTGALLLGPARGAAAAARTVLPALGRRMATGAAAGAVQGAVSGAGAANGDVRSRLAAAFLGGTIGTVAGAALPGVGAAAGTLAGMTRRGAGRIADDEVLHALTADGTTLGALRQAVQRGVREGTALFDLGGENVRSRLRAAGDFVGPAKEKLVRYVEGRRGQAPARIEDAITRTTGQARENAWEAAADRVAKRAQEAKPLYDAAYATPDIDDPEVIALLSHPVYAKAYARVKNLLAADPDGPVVLRDLVETVAGPDGAPMKVQNPIPVRALDKLKQGIDAQVQSGAGSDGALTRAEARTYNARLRQVLARVDELRPEYARARASFAGESSLLEAHTLGREALTTSADEMAFLTKHMGAEERAELARGAAAAVRAKAGGVQDGSDATRQLFSRPETRARLRAAFPDDDSFREFGAAMEHEHALARHENFVSPNVGSSTAPRLLAALDSWQGVAAAGAASAGTQSLSPLFGLAATVAAKRGRESILSNTNDAVADRLLASSRPEIESVVDRLAARIQERTAAAQRGAVAAGAVGRVGGAATGRER